MQIRWKLRITGVASALLFSLAAGAQESNKAIQRNGGYDVSRETVLQGMVVSFAAQSGAHVVVQTASGTVDVHLGNAKLLKSAGIDLAAGESVRIIGENIQGIDGSSVFAARILQKGSQAVALRNTKGFPLAATATPAPTQALRGVR
jgi:hypothetical protein